MENYRFHSSPDDDDDIDRLREAVEAYSLSADVSESESCSSTSALSCDLTSQLASASLSSSHQLDYSSESDFPAPLTVMLPVVGGRHVIIPAEKKPEKTERTELSEVDLMKERYAKLLLGEDMSGGGKGVCTALAISSAITNLAASVFGELWKLEPLGPKKKSMWLREMDWLLCVVDHIVELIPSVQELPGGKTFEVMVPQSRSDLSVNLPALKKLDAMLLGILDGFRDCEFYYVDRGIIFADDGEYKEAKSFLPFPGRPSISFEEKWWLPFPKVPPNGLSEETRKRLLQCRECTNQIYKAAVAINSNVLAEMEIPKDYLDKLNKSGKACMGETLYSYITDDQFSPESLLDYFDLSSEYTALDIANRTEAALHFWRQKFQKRKVTQRTGRSSWNLSIKGLLPIEKTKTFAHRAETLLKKLKLRFPTLPQTVLDAIKIQNNKDVGLSILESYSRVMEGLAFNLMARIDDLLYVDDVSRRRAAEESASMFSCRRANGVFTLQKQAACGSAAPVVRNAKKTNATLRDPMDNKIDRLNA